MCSLQCIQHRKFTGFTCTLCNGTAASPQQESCSKHYLVWNIQFLQRPQSLNLPFENESLTLGGKKRLKIIWVKFPVANSLSFKLNLTNLYSANGTGSTVIRLDWFNTSLHANEKCWFHVKKDFPVLFHGDLFPKRKILLYWSEPTLGKVKDIPEQQMELIKYFLFINLKIKSA